MSIITQGWKGKLECHKNRCLTPEQKWFPLFRVVIEDRAQRSTGQSWCKSFWIFLTLVAQSGRLHMYQIAFDMKVYLMSLKVKMYNIDWIFQYQACLCNSKQSSLRTDWDGFCFFPIHLRIFLWNHSAPYF